ncbi:T3SS effector HopA1 family protein [Nocardia brasiliensis]|uniref:T3SS effector HopA1 family protein n=1 Tax=Nocardia brasiliensis TaxID=37326 RepID=UPI000316B70A|nr:T3SS effector HopA1 family protein [Nocardia brasiliensis]
MHTPLEPTPAPATSEQSTAPETAKQPDQSIEPTDSAVPLDHSVDSTSRPATPDAPIAEQETTESDPAPKLEAESAQPTDTHESAKQSAQSTDPAVTPDSTEPTDRPVVPDTPVAAQHTTEKERGAAPVHDVTSSPGVRWRGPRSAVVNGIRAPAGHVWESMRDDGDCLPLLLERMVYPNDPPLTQKIMDKRLAALRAEIATEIETNADDYFEQFVALVDAASVAPPEAPLLRSEEVAALQTARDNNRLRAEFDRQVQAIRTPRVWRNAASHLTSRAAGTMLQRRGLFLALYNDEYRTRPVILGVETTEAASATALNYRNHFYLAVPRETHALGSSEPSRTQVSPASPQPQVPVDNAKAPSNETELQRTEADRSDAETTGAVPIIVVSPPQDEAQVFPDRPHTPPTITISTPEGTTRSADDIPAPEAETPVPAHESAPDLAPTLSAPPSPPVQPIARRSESVLSRAAAEFEGIFDRPRTLPELYRTLLPEWPDLSFEDLAELRTHSYAHNGQQAPTVSRENLDEFLHAIWDERESIATANHIYNAYLSRGAGDRPENPRAFRNDIAWILTQRTPGPAQQGFLAEAGVLTPDNADRWAPGNIPVVHFDRQHRPDLPADDNGFKIYLNATGAARSDVVARVVREVLDNPERFPGVGEVKAFGPLERRADGIVVYVSDLDTVQRVVAWLREFQDEHAEMFHWDVPAGSEQVLAGVGFGAEIKPGGFGANRAFALFEALNLHRHNTFDDFAAEVRAQFRSRGIDPEQVHLNLPALRTDDQQTNPAPATEQQIQEETEPAEQSQLHEEQTVDQTAPWQQEMLDALARDQLSAAAQTNTGDRGDSTEAPRGPPSEITRPSSPTGSVESSGTVRFAPLLDQEPPHHIDADETDSDTASRPDSPADSASIYSTDSDHPARSQDSPAHEPITDERTSPVMPISSANIHASETVSQNGLPRTFTVDIPGRRVSEPREQQDEPTERKRLSSGSRVRTEVPDTFDLTGAGWGTQAHTVRRSKSDPGIRTRDRDAEPSRPSSRSGSDETARPTETTSTTRPPESSEDVADVPERAPAARDDHTVTTAHTEQIRRSQGDTTPPALERRSTPPGTDGSTPARAPAGQPSRSARMRHRMRGFVTRLREHGEPSEPTPPPGTAAEPSVIRRLRTAFQQFAHHSSSSATTSVTSATPRTVRGDGTAAHTTTSDAPAVTVHGSEPDFDCLTTALTDIHHDNNSRAIRPDYRSTALPFRSKRHLPGRSRREAEKAAGGKLRGYADEHRIAKQLQILGPGAQALVVGVHPAVNANGIGAHAYRMVNDRGVIVVRDAADPAHRLPGQGSAARVFAVLYSPTGNQTQPLRLRGEAIPEFPRDIRIGAPYEATGTRRPGSPTAGPSRAADTTPHPAGRGTLNTDGSTSAHTGDASRAQPARGSRSAGRLRRFVSRLRGRDAPDGGTASIATQQAPEPQRTTFRRIRTLFRPPLPTPSDARTVHAPTVHAPRGSAGDAVADPLGKWNELPAESQGAVLAMAANPAAVEQFLSDPESMAEIMAEMHRNYAAVNTLRAADGEVPDIRMLSRLLEELRIAESKGALAQRQASQFEILDEMFSHPVVAPAEQWAVAVGHHTAINEMSAHFPHLDGPFDGDALREQVETLNELADQPLSLTEPMRVVQDLDDIDFLDLPWNPANHADVIGTTVTPGVFLVTTAKRAAPQQETEHRLILTVHPGADGLVFGDAAQPRLLLKPDTPLRITGVRPHGDGYRIEAEVGSSATGSAPARRSTDTDDTDHTEDGTREFDTDSIVSADSDASAAWPGSIRETRTFVGDTADEGRIDDDGVRVFDTDTAGDRFGTNHLRTLSWDEHVESARKALVAHGQNSVLNNIVRSLSDIDLDQFCARIEHSVALYRAIVAEYGTEFAFGALRTTRDELAGRTDLDERQTKLLGALTEILGSENPFRRWQDITADAYIRQDASGLYRRTYGAEFGPEVVREHRESLDRATGRPLPSTEPFRVLRTLESVDFLLAQDGAPLNGRNVALAVGVSHRDPGYLSTSLTANPIRVSRFNSNFVLELEVPPGARGIYVGSDGGLRQNELLFARNTRYRITGIGPTIHGVTILRGRIEPDETAARHPDCAPLALRYVADQNPRAPITAPAQHSVGLGGMSAEQFNRHAGGELRTFTSHAEIEDELRQLGAGAFALVVDAYHGPVDEHGIGAHTVVFENDHTIVHGYDPITEDYYPIDRHPTANVRAITAIVYRPDGSVYTADREADGAAVLGDTRIGAPDRSAVAADNRATEPMAPTEKRDRFGIATFLGSFGGAAYSPGTKLSFHATDRTMHAEFGATGVTVSWTGNRATPAPSEHPLGEFWHLLRTGYEPLGFTAVRVAQPPFHAAATARILSTPELRNVLTANSLDTETEIHFQDGADHRVAVVRRDGNLAVRDPHTAGDLPPDPRAIISRAEFLRRLGERGTRHVRVAVSTPLEWHRVPSIGPDNLYPTLARILTVNAEVIRQKTEWRMAAANIDSALEAAAQEYALNIVFERPDEPRITLVNSPKLPKFFLRQTLTGYEIGITATGHYATVVTPDLAAAQVGVPREQIPAPRTTMLAGGPEPPLEGAAVRRNYIPERGPVSARAPEPAVVKKPRRKRTTWIRHRTVPAAKLAGRNVQSAHLPRPTFTDPTPVHYMDEVEREAHRLYVDKTGRLRHARNGSLFQAERNEDYLGDRKYIFVMDEFGNLYAGEKIKGLIQHSSFLGGRIVTAAGAISAKDGIVTRIVDSSGHYAPDEQTNDYALAFLEVQGLRFSDDFQRVYYSNNDQFLLRAPAVQERVRAAALARVQRILNEGPTFTAPFKVYRTETTQRYLSWRDFPPGTTIAFQDALFDTTATVTEDLTFRVFARSIDGSQPDRAHELDGEALRELVFRLDVGSVRVERPEVPVYTYYGEDLLHRMAQGEADFHADNAIPTPGDQRAPPSHHDQPVVDRTMPSRWEPVQVPGDPGFAAIAQLFGISEVARVRRHILDHLREEATIEHERREEVDDSRVAGDIDDTEWQDELRDRHEFDRWRSTAYWDLVDPTAVWQTPDFDAGDRLLRLVAAAYEVNVVSVHPDGQVREIIHSAERSTVFLRRTAAGHFEIGATATGTPLVEWPQQRVWDALATPNGRVPRNQIPEPLRLELTKPHIPLLSAAVPSKFSEEGSARPIHYMDADELESHRLFLGPDGRLHRASDGSRFDTTKLLDWPGPSRIMLFVMDEFGNLYAAATEPSGRIQHASFLGEGQVTAAGEIGAVDGMLDEWSDSERQGPPHPEHNDFALDWLRRRGLALAPGFRRTDADAESRDRVGEPMRQRTRLTHRRILADATDKALHRIENASAQSPAARVVTQVAREQLATEQRRLRRWQQLFHVRRISKTEQINSFAHPLPVSANDRLVPPGSIDALRNAEGSAGARAAWWVQHGRAWWAALQFADLAPDYQERLLADFPGLRNGDGIPAEVRDTLNRRHILLESARLKQATEAGVQMPSQQRRSHNLETTLVALHGAELEAAIAAQRSGGAVATVRLLSFHQDLQGRAAKVAIAFGPVDTAATIDRQQTDDAAVGSLLPAVPQAVRVHQQNASARTDHATVLTLGQDDGGTTGPRTRRGTTAVATDGSATLPTRAPTTATQASAAREFGAARPAALRHQFGESARPTTGFEPPGDETYFGALLESFRYELDGPTHPSRTRVDDGASQPPTPAEHRARMRTNPPLEVPSTIEVSSRLAADGRPALTLVDEQGAIAMLPASGRVHAIRVDPPDGSRPYFLLNMQNAQLRVPEMLVSDFRYVPGTDTTPGTLSWHNVAEIRLVGYDRQKVAQRVTLRYQDELVVQPPSGQWRFFAKPDTDELTWFTFFDPNNLLPEAPELRNRRDEDLFGPFGPQPQDAVQGAAGYCSLIAPLKQIAQHDPASIEQMLHDNGDGTVYVRLRVDDTIEWELVEKSIHVTPGTEIGHYIRHEPGQPLWPAMIAKAYAQRFGGHLGYIVGINSHLGRMDIFGHLDPGFAHRPGGMLPQPTRAVRDYFYQLHFDPDTLERIVGGDPEFRRRVADLLDELETDLEDQRNTADQTILADHPNDAAARESAWDRFENTEALDVLAGFRSHLDRHFPGQWETEKNKLIEYFTAVYDGPPEERLLDDGYRFVGEAIAERIAWALRRGPVILGTNVFGGGRDNTTAVPGLVGNHSYAVLDVVRDATGTPTALLLEDPGARHRVSNTPGIEYLLPASGSTYTTEANGTRVRTDPDGSKETFSATSGRYWRDADGEQRWTSRTGAKMRKPRGATQWTLDPTRKDPPDGTIPRHGIVRVDLRHLPKFNGLAIGGPAAYGLYGPEVPTGTSPSTSATPAGHSAAPHTDQSAPETARYLSGEDDRRAPLPEVQTGAGTHAPTSATPDRDPRLTDLLREQGILPESVVPTLAHVDRLLTDFQPGAVTAVHRALLLDVLDELEAKGQAATVDEVRAGYRQFLTRTAATLGGRVVTVGELSAEFERLTGSGAVVPARLLIAGAGRAGLGRVREQLAADLLPALRAADPSAVHEVPREMNFAWFGGELSATALANVKAWVASAGNSNWAFTFWTQTGYDKVRAQLGQDPQIRAAVAAGRFRVRDDLRELVAEVGSAELAAIYEASLRAGAFNLTSDIGRYALLVSRGGVYADVDLAPGAVRLAELEPMFLHEEDVPVFGVLIRGREDLEQEEFEGLPFAERLRLLVERRYRKGMLGNQFIVAPPNSRYLADVMTAIPQRFIARYPAADRAVVQADRTELEQMVSEPAIADGEAGTVLGREYRRLLESLQINGIEQSPAAMLRLHRLATLRGVRPPHLAKAAVRISGPMMLQSDPEDEPEHGSIDSYAQRVFGLAPLPDEDHPRVMNPAILAAFTPLDWLTEESEAQLDGPTIIIIPGWAPKPVPVIADPSPATTTHTPALTHDQRREAARLLFTGEFTGPLDMARQLGRGGVVALRDVLSGIDEPVAQVAATALTQILHAADPEQAFTDLRAQHWAPNQTQRQTLATHGLEPLTVEHGGDSLFESFVLASGSVRDPTTVRAEAIDHIAANRDDYYALYHPPGVTEQDRPARFDAELQQLRAGLDHNDLAELLPRAIAESQHTTIALLDDRQPTPIGDPATAKAVLIRIDYGGGHYHAAVRSGATEPRARPAPQQPPATTTGPALWQPMGEVAEPLFATLAAMFDVESARAMRTLLATELETNIDHYRQTMLSEHARAQWATERLQRQRFDTRAATDAEFAAANQATETQRRETFDQNFREQSATRLKHAIADLKDPRRDFERNPLLSTDLTHRELLLLAARRFGVAIELQHPTGPPTRTGQGNQPTRYLRRTGPGRYEIRRPDVELPIDTPAPPRIENPQEVSAYAAAVWDAPSPQVALALVARLDSQTVAAVRAAYPGKEDLAADLRAALPEVNDYIDRVFAEPPMESASPVPMEVGTADLAAARRNDTIGQAPDGSAPVPPRIGAIPGRDNCVPLTLTYLSDFIGEPGFRLDHLHDGLAGTSHRQLEQAIPGARLHTVDGPDTITDVLRAPGPATHALIVENHTSADENNVGAHFHVVTNVGKAGRPGTQDLYTHDVDPHDPERIRTHPHTPRPQQHITTTDVVYLDQDGNVVAPPERNHTPTTHPRHRIGLDDDPEAGGPSGSRVEVFQGRPESFPEQFRFDAEFGLYPLGTLVHIVDAAGTLQLAVTGNDWVTANYGDGVNPGQWVETFAGDIQNAAEHVARHLSAVALVRIEIHYPTPQTAPATWVSAEEYDTAVFVADSSALPGDEHTDASRAGTRADMESWVAHCIIGGYTNRDILDHLREYGFTDLTKPQVDACVQDLYASARVDFRHVEGSSRVKRVENFARNYRSRIDQGRLDALPIRARRLERAVFGHFRDNPGIGTPNNEYYKQVAHALAGTEVDGEVLGSVSPDLVSRAVSELLARAGIPTDHWIKHPVRNILDPRATLAALAHGLQGRLDRAGVAEFMRSGGLAQWSTLLRPTQPSLEDELFEYLYANRNNPSAVGYESISAHLASKSFGSVSRLAVHDSIAGIIRKIKVRPGAKRLGAAESPANRFLKIAAQYPDAVEAYRASRGEPSGGSGTVPAR